MLSTQAVHLKSALRVLLFSLVLASCKSRPEEAPPEQLTPPSGAAQWSASKNRVTCPVCGLEFPKEQAAGKVIHNAKTYYFYLSDHRRAFEDAPESYLVSGR